mmetsp:Transcript_1600/g.2549  ORF Transcript_1600/g.2549 Transcript_1600/m.2549 type:complete len:205 (+) Transcript_1600:18-632(+)
MTDQSWEPLPKRTKRKIDRSEPAVVSSARAVPANQRTIEDAVSARSNAHRAQATLSSKDGCDGDNYEYLDHTADVQCHSWGSDMKEAFEHMATCMFNYMTDLATVDINDERTITFTKTGHDIQSLLYNYMDELLYRFCTDSFCVKRVEITEFDEENFSLSVKALGDIYDPSKNPQGTEIKAITYSNMQIHVEPNRCDLYVIVDI